MTFFSARNGQAIGLMILVLMCLAPVHANVSDHRQAGFESGTFDGWSLKRLARPDSAQVVTAPVREGKYAARIELSPGDIYGDAFKSELSDPWKAPLRAETWYRVSHYIPAAFPIENDNACVIAQWHNSSPEGLPGGKPPLAHRISADGFAVTINYGTLTATDAAQPAGSANAVMIQTTLLKLDHLERDRWHDFVYRIRWAPDQTGEIDGWLNGRQFAAYRGPLGYAVDADGPYFKTGVYCNHSPKEPLAVFVDDYRRGSSRADVTE